ncbi:MAG: 5-formyltetrahydrofolate cyclo-ligase [Acidimicrobiia bacterium]|nr:5-formyltetrahydrofolate cyclo-ligase [Acidimicrobiia bacterium]
MSSDKQAVRERVWRELRRRGAARFPGAEGRIPNFVGAEAAARLLASLDQWRDAEVVKSNPDSPQLPVRTGALSGGKRVYMAVPRLRDENPFILLDPERIDGPPRRAASINGAASAGVPVALTDVPHIDLIVCGTVAVNRRGVRIGKGGGYSDIEFALLTETGAVDRDTVVATTVHSVQVLDEDLPETSHDFRVDLIVTPDEVIRCRRAHRPRGVIPSHLDPDMADAIPVLAGRA